MTSLPDPSNVTKHRVELTFEPSYGVTGKLICPESGCSSSKLCGHCGRDLHDTEATPCYDCKDAAKWADECWVKTWFDNLTADEMLSGKLTVEIDAQWDGDQLIAHIGQEAAGVSR
jgi:hypothetical protein